jgi:Flp pilus assembly pilin Flp
MNALRRFYCDQRGQALTEGGLLLAALLGVGAAGTAFLLKTHPDLLNALDIHVRGIYFVVSLPFP